MQDMALSNPSIFDFVPGLLLARARAVILSASIIIPYASAYGSSHHTQELWLCIVVKRYLINAISLILFSFQSPKPEFSFRTGPVYLRALLLPSCLVPGRVQGRNRFCFHLGFQMLHNGQPRVARPFSKEGVVVAV